MVCGVVAVACVYWLWHEYVSYNKPADAMECGILAVTYEALAVACGALAVVCGALAVGCRCWLWCVDTGLACDALAVVCGALAVVYGHRIWHVGTACGFWGAVCGSLS